MEFVGKTLTETCQHNLAPPRLEIEAKERLFIISNKSHTQPFIAMLQSEERQMFDESQR